MDKVKDYYNMGKTYFNHLEEKLGIHFGVSDRVILRDFVNKDGSFGLFGEMKRSVYSNLKSLGYDSAEFRDVLYEEKRDLERAILKCK